MDKVEATQTRPFNVSQYLDGAEDVSEYLNAALDGGGPEHVAGAIADVCRAFKSLQAQVVAKDAENAVEREAQFQWDEARWKLRMAPSRLPKSRSDFRTIARAALGQGEG